MNLTMIKLLKDLDPHHSSTDNYINHVLEIFPDKARNTLINNIVRSIAVELEGETDEPVTTDIKRLIRMVGSLHGKTGFVVTPLTRQEFDTFDPLRDAVHFSDDPVKVEVVKPGEIGLRGETVTLPAEGDICEIPECAAVFFCGRGMVRPLG